MVLIRVRNYDNLWKEPGNSLDKKTFYAKNLLIYPRDDKNFLIFISNPGFDEGQTQTIILMPNEQPRTKMEQLNGTAKQTAAGCGCMITVCIVIYNCWVVAYNASH